MCNYTIVYAQWCMKCAPKKKKKLVQGWWTPSSRFLHKNYSVGHRDFQPDFTVVLAFSHREKKRNNNNEKLWMKSKSKYRSATYCVFSLELSPCPGCRPSVWDQIFFFKRRWGRQLLMEFRDNFSLTCKCLSSDYFFL